MTEKEYRLYKTIGKISMLVMLIAIFHQQEYNKLVKHPF